MKSWLPVNISEHVEICLVDLKDKRKSLSRIIPRQCNCFRISYLHISDVELSTVPFRLASLRVYVGTSNALENRQKQNSSQSLACRASSASEGVTPGESARATAAQASLYRFPKQPIVGTFASCRLQEGSNLQEF